MGMVTLSVNGRPYEVICDDGEEERVLALGGSLDRRVRQLVASLGQVGEAKLLLLTCLTLEHEVAAARASVGAATAESGANVAGQPVEAFTPELDGLAERIEAVAGRLKPS